MVEHRVVRRGLRSLLGNQVRSKKVGEGGKITWRQEGDMEDRLLILIPL